MNKKRSLQIIVILSILCSVCFAIGFFVYQPSPRFPQLNEKRVSNIGSLSGFTLRWSPDGRYLAYEGEDDFIIYDLSTNQNWKGLQHLEHTDGLISKIDWHPSGSISYIKGSDTQWGSSWDGVEELHIAEPNGSNDRIVVENLPWGVSYIWFSNGQKLLMHSSSNPPEEWAHDVFIVDTDTGQQEAVVSHEELNLSITTMVLLPDENIVVFHGTREAEVGQQSYLVFYDLSERRVKQEIHLDPVFASGKLPGYPNLRPDFREFSLNYMEQDGNRWLVGDFWAPAGECYNYALYFFNLDDTSRNFCVPSAGGPVFGISLSPDQTRIAYMATDAPGREWVMVADLTPDILERLNQK